MKKSISILLVVAMLFSYMPGIDNLMYVYGQETVTDRVYEKEKTTTEDVYEKEMEEVIEKLETKPLMAEVKEVDYDIAVDEALEKVKGYYKENQIDYLAAMAYRHSSKNLNEDLKSIEKNLRKYEPKNEYNCYKGIMEAVSIDHDPRAFNYNGEAFNYVDVLVEKQKPTGEFTTLVDGFSYSILALDLASADYDKEKAIEALKNKFETKGDKAYIKEKWSADLKKTALAMIALSNHKDYPGVSDLLDGCVNYIKSEQEDDGGLGNYSTDPETLGKVIQGLIAAGENPLKGDYVKKNGTMLERLMECQNEDGGFRKGTWKGSSDTKYTEAAFAALADLDRNESMYHILKIKLGDTPSKIEIKADKTEIIKGKSIKLQAKVLDNENRLVTGQKIKWTSSDEKIATVENGVVKAIEKGDAIITVEIEGNPSIKETINIKVVDSKPACIKIYLKNEEMKEIKIKKDETIEVTAKVFDQDQEEIKDKEITWSLGDESKLVKIENGKITGLSKGNTSIKALCEGIEAICNIEVVTMKDIAKDVLDEVKTIYKNKSEYNEIEALALSYMGEDKKTIEEKIKIDTNLYKPNAYAKNIIKLIAAGLDPRDYNGHNYVEELSQSQNDRGYFKIGSSFTYPSNAEDIILPIIALDLAGESYDVEKAMSFLEKQAKTDKDSKYFDDSYDYNQIQMTAMAMIAMSKHMEKDGVKDLVQKCKTYLKKYQNQEGALTKPSGSIGYMDDNCQATAATIQAIIAIGEDPFAKEFTKNQNTLLDGLLIFRKGNKFKEETSDYITNNEATAYAFAALVDLYKNKSMYHEMKIETGTIPAKIEILADKDYVKEGQELKLRAKVTDTEGKIVPGQKIEWICSDGSKKIAVIDENGITRGKSVDKDQEITITAKIKDKNIKISKKMIVKARIPYEIKINLPSKKKDNNLKEGQELVLFKKVLEKDGEELDEDVIWSSSNKNIATVDQTGLVTAKEVQEDTKVVITVTSKSKKDIKGNIELNIIAIIPEKIVILHDDKEIDEKTIEAGYKLKLDAKAYEKDKSLIDKAEIEWKSSNNNVATIENGIITAKEVHEEKLIQITAKVKGFEVVKKLNLKVIPAQTNQEKAQNVIDDLKKYYEKDTKYDYLEAMALNRAGVNQDKIQEKLSIEKLGFKKGSQGAESIEYAKAIMSMISAGLDPRDYDGKDYVKYLADSQVEKGYFDAKGYHYSDDDEAENIAYSIIALDMAGAEYDVDKAIKYLKDKLYISRDVAYIKNYSWSDKPNLEKTAIALVALSKHTDKKDIPDLINKVKVCLKEEYNKWDEKTSSEDIANTIQALIAIGEDPLSEEYKKVDPYGNKVSMLDTLLKLRLEDGFKDNKRSTYIDKEATALVFAALTDINTEKSMYKEIKIKIGDPEKLEIVSENDKKELKIGKKLKLSAKTFDKDNKFVPSQKFIWSIDKQDIATIDKNTGEVTAIGSGTIVITAMVKDFENVKNTFELNIIPVTPNKIEVTVDKNIKEIEIGKKIKINGTVYDTDNDLIENIYVKWIVTPKDLGNIDQNGILTGVNKGKITITGIVTKDDKKEIQGETTLEIVKGKTKEEKINEAIKAVQGYFKKQNSYDYITSLGLRFTDVNVSDISAKKNIYSTSNLHNNARNIITLIAVGEDPKNYKNKNYVDLILNDKSKFYNDSNAGHVAKAIIALDMAGAQYEEKESIDALIGKLTKDNDQYYIQSKYTAIEDTSWVLIALSNHKEKAGVKEAIKGIKKYLKEKQDENAFIESCSDTAIVIQALMALGDDPLSEEWVKYDEYGNKITLLDAILLCRNGDQFKSKPSADWNSKFGTYYSLAALGDLAKNKSMYYELRYTKAGKVTSIKINSEDLNILVGEEKIIEAQAFDEKNVLAKNAEIIWESSNPKVVEVKDGKVIALSAGEAKITAKLKENDTVFDDITVKVSESQDISLKVKASINKLVDFYDQHGSYDYMAALASKHIGEEFNVNKEKIASNLRLYRKDYAIHYAKNIMEIIAVGENPRNYELKDEKGNIIGNKNYVHDLEKAQKENGEFIVGQGADQDSIVTLSLSIMALDMADGNYNVEKAINKLVNMLKDEKYENDGLYTAVETKALAITALSRHKDIGGVDPIIDDCIQYIKSNQNEDGGFDHSGYENNPFAMGTVIQGLVANNVDPVKWVKNGKSIVDVLLERQLENGGFEYNEQVPSTPDKEIFDDFKCTETAFAALADLYKKESMYHKIQGKNELKEKLKNEIEILNKAYEDEVVLDYLSSLSGNLSGIDKEFIKRKLPKNEKANSAWMISKQIMCLIGAELDPRSAVIDKDEVKNFVHELASSQVTSGDHKGEFVVKSSDENSIEALAYSIIALDMADGKYDKEAAAKRLLQMIKDKKSTTYKEVATEALVLTALSKHKDVDGVEETIKNLIDFLKLSQNEDGGFDTKSISLGYKNSTIATGRVIQALIANKIDPIHSKEWIKNDKTMLDALLKNKVVTEDLQKCGYAKGEGQNYLHANSTHQAFAALVDIYNNQSMFEKLAIKNDGPEITSKEKIDRLIKAVNSYYQTDYFTQNQGQLNALETATLTRAGVDLSKWSTNIKHTTKYDPNLKNVSSIITQVSVLLDIGKDPKDFEGRNLVQEITDQLDSSTNPYVYMNGVTILDKYNKKYPNQKISYNVEKVIQKIISKQASDGGFIFRGNESNPRTTGDALLALSKHKNIEGVEESIDKAVAYLHSIQKEDGGLYDATYVTGYHADIVRGLLAVGEDVQSQKWTKSGKNPVDALFILWKENNSFDNKEGESENNRGWIEATQKGLYTLIELQEAGYGEYYAKDVKISAEIQEPEKTCQVYTAIVVPENGKYVAYSKAQQVTISSRKHTGGFTPIGALQATTTLCDIKGNMVTAIYGIENKGNGGWMYAINDQVGKVMADQAIVNDGDKITWYYSPEGMDGKVPKWDEIEGEIPDELKLMVEGIKEEMIVTKEEIVFTAKASEKEAKVIVKLGNTIIEPKDNKYKVVLQKGENNITIEAIHKEQKVQNIYKVMYQTSSKFATKLIEYKPAPGQFINDKYGTIEDAKSTLYGKDGLVSLGAFGGSIVYGFDHTIENNKGARDFKVYGNAFKGNEEPAGVAIMKDTNKNGLADDTWYYLAGSEYNNEKTIKNYQVTYKNPGNTKGVHWTDNQGNSGVIKQNSDHKQEYYPSKENFSNIDQNKYTLSGNLINTRTPKWGYADVTQDGDEMDIDWAVDENGNKVNIDEVDFIKVYTAVQMNTELFGEVSSEVAGIEDLEETKDQIVPTIKIENIEDGSIITTQEVIFNVVVEDNVDQNIVPVVKVGDGVIKPTEDGSYKVTLKEGENTILIEAIDEAGNRSEKKLKITYAKSKETFKVERVGNETYKNGDEAKVVVKAINLNEDKKEGMLIVALYDQKNKMVNYCFVSREILPEEEVKMSGGFLVPKEGEYKIKAFVWDNMTEMNVLSKNIIQFNVEK